MQKHPSEPLRQTTMMSSERRTRESSETFNIATLWSNNTQIESAERH